MRRAATVILVVLAVLVVVGVVVDRVVVSRVEDNLLAQAGEQIEIEDGAEVVIDGFPFLTQVAAGELAEVRGDAAGLVLDGFVLEDVRVVARGVGTEEPYPAQTVEINAVVPVATLQAAVDDAIDLPATPQVAVVDGLLQLQVEALGVELSALLDPVVVDGEVALGLGEVLVGDASVPDDVVEVLDGLLSDVRLEIPGLPEGLEPTRLAVGESGLSVRLEGSDVELATWRG